MSNGLNIKDLEMAVITARRNFNTAQSDETKEAYLKQLNDAQNDLARAMYPGSGAGSGAGSGSNVGVGTGSNQEQGQAGDPRHRHQGWAAGRRVEWGEVSAGNVNAQPLRDQYERLVAPQPPHGGKKHKSKQTKLRSKKYKGKRSKKTRTRRFRR